MANIEKHEPGSFCWIELATSDQNAAKAFYTSLFGWTFNEFPMGPSEIYTIFQLEGRDTAAGYTMRKEDRDQGVPPHWMLYIAVTNADEAAAKAAQLGAKVLSPAFDVFDVGRMAVIQDPTGAIFAAWQAKRHTGIGISGKTGTLCWADLNTPDAERASQFYRSMFGWEIAPGESKDANGYLHIKNGEQFIGGIPPAAHRNPNAPPNWLLYFYADDVDATAGKAKELGGAFRLPPMTMENVGRMSVIADPQGASFAIFKEAAQRAG